MACYFCKGDLHESTTVFTVQSGDGVIVIKNVPCLECAQCGETVISDEVMMRLEELIAEAKKLLQEVAVIDFAKAA
jgi:YgiT-type zinc finger domain-containing protein